MGFSECTSGLDYSSPILQGAMNVFLGWQHFLQTYVCDAYCTVLNDCTVGPPTFQAFDLVHYVIVNDSFVLNCTATNDPQSPNGLIFRWFIQQLNRNRMRIDKKKQWNITKHVITAVTVTSQLYISVLQMDQHNGTYSCEVDNNKKESFIKQSTSVVVEGKYS